MESKKERPTTATSSALCYHPLFLFNQLGDLEYAMLRRGNKASAKFWRRVLLPVIERYRELDIPKFFRGDAAFAMPKLMPVLERRRLRVRHPHQGQRRSGAGNRASAHPSRGSAFPQAQGLLPQLSLPGEVVATRKARGGQDRMARGRVVPARRIHRDQPDQALEERRANFTTVAARRSNGSRKARTRSSGRSSLAARSRTIRRDCSCLPWRTTWPTSCGGWHCPRSRALVADDAPRKVGEDWGEGRAAREVRDVPVGRSGRDAAAYSPRSSTGLHGWRSRRPVSPRRVSNTIGRCKSRFQGKLCAEARI